MGFLGDLFGRDPERSMRRDLAREARHYAGVLVRKLERLNICYRYPKSKGDFLERGTQNVKFKRCVTTPEAFYYEIDTLRLPRGISLADVSRDDVLNDLGVSVRHPITFRYGVRTGAWLVLERDAGVWGIPSKLTLATVAENWPDNTTKNLLVPMGVGSNRRVVYRSLAEMPHALVGGATGSGKTTLLHAWLWALIAHNTPGDFMFAFVDLKGGTEAAFYSRCPNVIDGGIVEDRGGVIELLEQIQALMSERLGRFKAAGVRNIAAWNYHHRTDNERMPYIALFVDELANIMLDSAVKKRCQELLADITARGRAPGVHAVLATQRPEVAVVPGLIKANTDSRLAFRMTDNASSRVILDTTEAARFDDTTPRGRYVFRRGVDRAEYQAPLITEGQIREAVGASRRDDGKNDAVTMSPEEVLTFCWHNMRGEFSRVPTYQALRGCGVEVSHTYLTRIGREWENKTIEIDGQQLVLKPAAGRRPRILEPI